VFIIKSYRNDGNGRRRIYFWQVPWARIVDGGAHEIGGWVTGSKYATKYVDPDEAERVILIRSLDAEVDEERPAV
jgi:hypothetical protein